jgi:hypothetical protein
MSNIKNEFITLREEELATEQTGLSFELDNLMASDKAFRTTLAQSVVQDVTEGNLDATQVLIYACKGEEFFKSVIDNVRPIVAGKQIQKGGLKLHEAELIEKKNPDKYDFSVCGDSVWDSLNAKLNQIKTHIKARETFLKSLTEPVATMDGEIINPPAITYGAMNVSVSLK